MLKKDIKVGGVYEAKVNGRLTKVRVDGIDERDGYKSVASGYTTKSATRYRVTNLATGRTTVFRSASKFRKEAASA